jgi:ubiquinone/menaquinone biosynthesis C-methylase UbiE
VEYLVCPICRKKLSLKISKKEKNEIIGGVLSCTNKHKFKILNGIPRFVTDTAKEFVITEDAFSSKWKKFNKHYHDKKWRDFQLNWLIERFDWKSYGNFIQFLKSKKKILEAGSGIGNSAKLLATNPNSAVFAIDASQSIDFAYKKYGDSENLHFLQADLRQLPFKKQFFDYVFSDQVLHHTKNTETSFKYLTKFLKKNGFISVYVYNKKAPIREFADDYIRSKTTKMSEKECIEFSKDMAYLGKSLANLKKKITIKRDISVLKIKAGTYDVQRFIYWYFLKCFWADDGDLARSIGVNFDWYFPKLAFRHTPHEVKKWCKDVNLKVFKFKEVESGISVTAKK